MVHRHHRAAGFVISGAVVLDVALGLAYSAVTPGLPWWHGVFCAIANAVTVGGDVPPANGAGYVITGCECVVVVPLFAAAFSLLTSGLMAGHVRNAEDRLHKRIDNIGRRPDE